MRQCQRTWWAVVALACVPGCAPSYGGSPGGSYPVSAADVADPGVDGGTAAGADASQGDGPQADSGADTGKADGGKSDGGKSDAGKFDAGTTDTAQADAGQADVKTDAGTTDAGSAGVSLVSSTCVDGKYAEVLPSTGTSIKAELAGYDAGKAIEVIKAVLAKRYPTGLWLLDAGATKDMGGGKTCLDVFFHAQQASTSAGALGQASTLVHECGHMFDNSKGSFGATTFAITPELSFTCQGLKYKGTNAGFARSRIKSDEFGAAWPPCATAMGGKGCDGYAPVYLDGDPDDAKFDSGDQGYDMVLEETTQYVNSLATDMALIDQSPYTVTAEDGILTYLWYVERYLHMARLQYPDAYAYLAGNACWRQATLTLWGRAWLYLEQSQTNPKLNFNGPLLRKLVKTPALLDEIERLRIAEGCP